MKHIKETERILKALANGRRLQIVKYLTEHKQASVGTLATHIKLSFKSTSRHLSVLSNGGVLEKEQVSTTMLYSLRHPISPITKTVLSIG